MILAAALAITAAAATEEPVAVAAISRDSDAGLAVLCYPSTGVLEIGLTWPSPLGLDQIPVFWRVDDQGDWDADMMTIGDSDAGFIAEGDGARVVEILDVIAAGDMVTFEPQNGGAGAASFTLDRRELARVRAPCGQ